jgi:hypothetical protein
LVRYTVKEPMKGILVEDPISEEGSSEGFPPETTKSQAKPQASSSNSSSNLQVKDPKKKKSSRSPEVSKNDFHVFIWLNEYSDGNNSSTTSPIGGMMPMPSPIKTQDLEDDLEEIDTFLSQKTSLNDRITYRSCPFQKRNEVYRLLSKERRDITAATDSSQDQREMYENKVDILNAVDLIFQFFFPPKFQGPTVGKYWGAVFQLLKVCVTGNSRAQTELMCIGDVPHYRQYYEIPISIGTRYGDCFRLGSDDSSQNNPLSRPIFSNSSHREA